MKITSGRIQRAGLNPNSGKSLGFYGVGALGQSPGDVGISVDANGNVIPASNSLPASSYTQTTSNIDTSAVNAEQNLINAMTPAQYAAYQTQITGAANTAAIYGTPTTTTTQPFQWGALLMGLTGVFFVVVLVKGNKR